MLRSVMLATLLIAWMLGGRSTTWADDAEDEKRASTALATFRKAYDAGKKAKDVEAMERALDFLGEVVRDRRVIQALADVIKQASGHEEELARIHAITLLGRGDPKHAASAFESCIKSVEDTRTRGFMLQELGRMQDPSVAAALNRLLGPMLDGCLAEQKTGRFSYDSNDRERNCEYAIDGLGHQPYAEAVDSLLSAYACVISSARSASRDAARQIGCIGDRIADALFHATGTDQSLVMKWRYDEWRDWWSQNKKAFETKEADQAGSPRAKDAPPITLESDSESRAQSMLMVADQFAKNKMPERAVEKLRDLIASYPDTQAAKEAQERLTELGAEDPPRN